ncbi:MAG: hypothetical protein U0U69_11800 [Acidimicrobiia bacterium]
MEIVGSARKHGITDDDIRAAVRAEFRSFPTGHGLFIIGADRSGRLLEIVVVDPDDDPVVIHAMPLREKFYDLLR